MIFRRLKTLGLDWNYHWDEDRPVTPAEGTSPPEIVVAYQDVYGRPPKRWLSQTPTATPTNAPVLGTSM
jgi:hypothetical protein